MTRRALAALALGGTLFFSLPGLDSALAAGQPTSPAPHATERFRLALAADPDNLTLHYLLGIALLQDNANSEALKELRIAYPAYQDSIEANYNLAVAALRLKDLDSTEIYLDQAMTLGADRAPDIFPVANLYYNMALVSQDKGDSNEAIRFFQRVLNYAPERFEVYRQLGDLYANRGEPNLATSSFRRYLQAFPDDPVSREYLFALEFNLGQDALAAGAFDQADSHFRSALEVQPESPMALYYLGYIAYVQDAQNLAAERLMAAFEKADANLRETLRPLLYNTALALRQSGQTRLAADTIAFLADQAHPLFNELYLAGTTALALSQDRMAQSYFRRAIALAPEDPAAQRGLIAAQAGAFDEWLSLAASALEDNDYEQAEAALGEARALQPDNARIKIFANRITQSRNMAARKADLDRLLAEAGNLSLSGQLLEAENLYRRILAVSPEHPAAQEGLKQVSEARREQVSKLFAEGQQALDTGQVMPAIRLFEQALSLDPGHEQAKEALFSSHQLLENRRTELLTKGRQAMGREQFDEARRWFEQAQQMDVSGQALTEFTELADKIRSKVDELVGQADLATRRGQYRQAGKLFRRALQLDPGHGPALAGSAALNAAIERTLAASMREADQASRQGDDAKAAQAYRAILDINPDHPEALTGMRQARLRLSEDLEQTVMRGEDALRKGDLDEAHRALAEALDQDPYHDRALQLRQHLEQLSQDGIRPGDEQKLYLQGIAFYTQGDYEQAIRSWEKVLRLNPEHEKALQNIAKTRHKLKQIKEFGGG